MNEQEARALIEPLTLPEKLALLALLDTISEEANKGGCDQAWPHGNKSTGYLTGFSLT